MSKLNPTNGERMAVIENDIKAIKSQNTNQYVLLGKIESKLDSVMVNKADKEEVNILRNKINKIMWQVVTALIVMLVGVVGFLLKQTFFS